MAMLYNTGIDCMPTDAELGKLFGNRGDLFLKEVPAKVMSQRGYGNMPNRKPIKPSCDINISYPMPTTHKYENVMVYTDFPKGAGGVSPNPMWADGTYDEMKANFIRQADEQNDVRHLIPDLEIEQRLKRYELSNFTGGSAQQNKTEFAIGEIFNAERREEAKRKFDTIKSGVPGITDEKALELVIADMRIDSLRLLHKKLAVKEPYSDWEKKLDKGVIQEVDAGNIGVLNMGDIGEQETDLSELARQRELERRQQDAERKSPSANANKMPGAKYAKDTIKVVGEKADIESYSPYSGKSRSITSAPSTAYDERGNALMFEEQRKQGNKYRIAHSHSKVQNIVNRFPFTNATIPTPGMSRRDAGELQGVGSIARPNPMIGGAGGGGSGGSQRPRGRRSHPAIQHYNEYSF